jgi:hypothetical protein
VSILKSWIWTGYLLNSTNSSVTSRHFSSFVVLVTRTSYILFIYFWDRRPTKPTPNELRASCMFLVLWANGLHRLHLLPQSVLFWETSVWRLLWLVWYPFYIPNLPYAACSLAYKLLVGPSRHWLKTPPQPSTIENDVWLPFGLVALMYLDHNVSSRS